MRRRITSTFMLVGTILVVLIMAIGCGTTRIVDPFAETSTNDTLSIGSLNRELFGREVVVKQLDGSSFRAHNVVVTRDSIEFTESASQLIRAETIDSIREVRWADRLGGALDGMLFSALPAAFIAELKPDVGGSDRGPGIKGGLVVEGVGTLLGMMMGRWHVYEFRNQSAIVP